jgi:hypothetical protein
LRKFEVKTLKKLAFILRILVKTELKILLSFVVEKIEAGSAAVKIKKIILTGSF